MIEAMMMRGVTSPLVKVDTLSSTSMNGPYGIVISGNYAFVAGSYADSITAIDISDPTAMVEVATLSSVSMDGAYGIVISGNYAFVTSINADSITAIDISDFI